jgi:hypothetical protein
LPFGGVLLIRSIAAGTEWVQRVTRPDSGGAAT